jgi:hypothetical protein
MRVRTVRRARLRGSEDRQARGRYFHAARGDRCDRLDRGSGFRQHVRRARTVADYQLATPEGEFFRILRPGGRVSIIAFKVDPAKVAGVLVLGADPVPD